MGQGAKKWSHMGGLRKVWGGGWLAFAPPQFVHQHVHHGRGVEREQLAQHQPAHHGNAQWLAQLGPVATAHGQRQGTQQGGGRGHEDGPQPQLCCAVNGLRRTGLGGALVGNGKVNHHDGVLLHDADEQNHADHGNERELGLNAISASSAPTPADGRVDKMVMG
jgi:hypothetical protein